MMNVDLLGLYYKHYIPFYDALSTDVSTPSRYRFYPTSIGNGLS